MTSRMMPCALALIVAGCVTASACGGSEVAGSGDAVISGDGASGVVGGDLGAGSGSADDTSTGAADDSGVGPIGGTHDTSAGDTSAVTDTGPADAAGPGADTGASDTSGGGDPTEPCPGCFGWPCEGAVDCASGWCIDGPDGQVCTKTCSEACPDGWSCLPVNAQGGDVSYVCVYLHGPLCLPCAEHDDCANPLSSEGGNVCLAEDDGAGSFCATGCNGGGCPPGNECVEVEVDFGTDALPVPMEVCRPAGGAMCECTTKAIETGAMTPCSVTNGAGTCWGERFCDVDGLTTCDAVAPAEDICDGIDNDCDGLTDEDYPEKGEACDGEDVDGCADGLWICDGAGLVCSDDDLTGEEVCDGIDNDCDGLTDAEDDDLFRPACELQDGVCGGVLKPANRCAAGAWKACTASDYTDTGAAYQESLEKNCDGLDNDCDGATDEDFNTKAIDGTELIGVDVDCGTGACANGLTACNAAGDGIVCPTDANATQEVCDALDNDCDGLTDLADEDMTVPPCAKQDGVCEGSSQVAEHCADGAWIPCSDDDYLAWTQAVGGPKYEASVEVSCDGADNDCSGVSDEDFGWSTLDGKDLTGVGAACGAGVCAGGATECNAAGDGIVCAGEADASQEVCDGVDNDCDGTTDALDGSLEAGVPCENQIGICGGSTKPTSLCAGGGWISCNAAAYTAHNSHYEAEESSCDQIDNDCDGVTDPPGSAECTLQWFDFDEDDYGDPNASTCACGGLQDGWVLNDDDCFDGSDLVNPEGGFSTSSYDGGKYDYNCDDEITAEQTTVAGICELAIDLGNICKPSGTTPGWQGTTVPGCGNTSQWVAFEHCAINIPCCAEIAGTCILPCLPECAWSGGSPKTQACK